MSFIPPVNGIINIDFECQVHSIGETNVNFSNDACQEQPITASCSCGEYVTVDIQISKDFYVPVFDGESIDLVIAEPVTIDHIFDDGDYANVEIKISPTISNNVYDGENLDLVIAEPVTIDHIFDDGDYANVEIEISPNVSNNVYDGESVDVLVQVPSGIECVVYDGESADVLVQVPSGIECVVYDGENVSVSEAPSFEILLLDGESVYVNVNLSSLSIPVDVYDGDAADIAVYILDKLECIVYDGENVTPNLFLLAAFNVEVADSENVIISIAEVDTFAIFSSCGENLNVDITTNGQYDNIIEIHDGEIVSLSVYVSAKNFGEVILLDGENCLLESLSNDYIIQSHTGDYVSLEISLAQTINVDYIDGEVLSVEVETVLPKQFVIDIFDGESLIENIETDDTLRARFKVTSASNEYVLCDINTEQAYCLFFDLQYLHQNRDADSIRLNRLDIDMSKRENCVYVAAEVIEYCEVNIAARPKFNVECFDGDYWVDRDPRNILDTIILYDADVNIINLESRIDLKTCTGNYEISPDYAVVELNDLTDYSCTSILCNDSNSLECDITVNPRIFINKIFDGDDVRRLDIQYESIITVIVWDGEIVICPNYFSPDARDGETCVCTLYSPPIHAFDGDYISVNITSNKALVWVSNGCLDNEYIPVIEETGTLDFENAVLTTAEFDPYKHEVRLRCINI